MGFFITNHPAIGVPPRRWKPPKRPDPTFWTETYQRCSSAKIIEWSVQSNHLWRYIENISEHIEICLHVFALSPRCRWLRFCHVDSWGSDCVLINFQLPQKSKFGFGAVERQNSYVQFGKPKSVKFNGLQPVLTKVLTKSNEDHYLISSFSRDKQIQFFNYHFSGKWTDNIASLCHRKAICRHSEIWGTSIKTCKDVAKITLPPSPQKKIIVMDAFSFVFETHKTWKTAMMLHDHLWNHSHGGGSPFPTAVPVMILQPFKVTNGCVFYGRKFSDKVIYLAEME